MRASTHPNTQIPVLPNTNSNIKHREKIEVELWMAINAVGVVAIAAVGVGFVLGRIGLAG